MFSRISHIAISFFFGVIFLTQPLFASKFVTDIQSQIIENNDTIATGWFQAANDRLLPFSASGGNIGIGTSSYPGKLSIGGQVYSNGGLGENGYFLGSNTFFGMYEFTNYLKLQSAFTNISLYGYYGPGNEIFRLTGPNNIARLTVFDTGKMVLSGALQITGGTPGSGKVLTSDADGLASWQTVSGGISSQWTTTGSNIAYTGGNVGIGTSSPSSKLQVNGIASFNDPNPTYTGAPTYRQTYNNTIYLGGFPISYTLYDSYDGGYWGNLFIGGAGLWSGKRNTLNGQFNQSVGGTALGQMGTGTSNNVFGWGSFTSMTTGSQNTAMGRDTGYNLTTGNNNSFFGALAGRNLIIGDNNIAIGSNAQLPSTASSNQLNIGNWIYGSGGNIGIGTTSPGAKLDIAGSIKIADGTQGAGKVLTSDANGLASWQTAGGGGGGSSQWTTNGANISYTGGNVGIGTSSPSIKLEVVGQVKITGGTPGAGKVLTSDANGLASWQSASSVNQVCSGTGNYNTCYGSSVLAANTSGNQNTAFGAYSMWYNTTGYNNTAYGMNSLQKNTTGYDNTANGIGSLYNNTTGYYNTSQGVWSLFYNTSGSQNVGIGRYSLLNNSTGNNNTAIGYNAGGNLTTGNNNVFIGYNIQPNISNTSSNQLNIGNWIYGDNGNIGIGTTTPISKLDVLSSYTGSTSNGNESFLAIRNTANGSQGIYGIGFFAQGGILQAGINAFNGTNGGANAHLTFYTRDIGGVYSEKMRINDNGNVGIGTTTPSYKLHVNGTAGGTSWTNTSDIRLKKNIETLPISSLSSLSLIRPVSFDWKNPKDDFMKQRQYGFIAQEVEKIYPNLVSTANDEMKTKSVNYDGFIPVLVASVQELQKENAELRARIEKLEQKTAH